MKIDGFNMATLVSMVNALGGSATMKTFSQRSKAIERINRLASEAGVDLETMFNDEGAVRPAAEQASILAGAPTEAPPALTALSASLDELQASIDAVASTAAPAAGPEATQLVLLPPENTIPVGPAPSTQKADSTEQADAAEAVKPAVKKDRGPSIRSVAEEKLLEVVGLDENKRRVGLSYEEILAYLHQRFPGCKTTVACLRWYAVHMRERNVMPPNRPRATGKRPAAVTVQHQQAA